MKNYEVIVVGLGHAGAESALAAARLGRRTLALTLNLDAIGFMACNPSIGGTAKGHLVREIDALGGEMGINADLTMLQLKMLNSGKGTAVQSLRAQSDKRRYHERLKSVLESTENLDVVQDEVTSLIVENGEIRGVRTALGQEFFAPSVVLATGVYLNSRVIIGDWIKNSGPAGFYPATELTQSVARYLPVRRFKTGTPPRVSGRSVDYAKMQREDGDSDIYTFSPISGAKAGAGHPCYLCYTNATTHKIILDNLDKAPLYNGVIEGEGPRYCPSIEVKVVRFRDKERHQLFIEPEGANTDEVYIQGLSTSLPFDVQEKIVHSIEGLENAKIMRYAYAIEYDCIDPESLLPTLRAKSVKGLYTAGQINGSSGYEEAAAQGLLAGINAAKYSRGEEEVTLSRSESYIGVLVDDLVTKGTNEPYRMMTGRAEYRIYLRQDNADIRLTEKGRMIGLVSDERYAVFKARQSEIERVREALETRVKADERLASMMAEIGEPALTSSVKLCDLIKRPQVNRKLVGKYYPIFESFNPHNVDYVINEIKYEGYIKKELAEIERARRLERISLPDIDYETVKGLRLEARQKLNKVKPQTVGQASRISGVSPADITVLLLAVKTENGR